MSPPPLHVSWRTHLSTWLQFVTRRRLAPYHPIPSLHESLRLLNLTHTDVLTDLGSGDGNTLIHAVQHYHVKHAYGYELNGQLYELAQQRVHDAQLDNHITLHHADACTADLTPATAILLYLSVQGNRSLLPLLRAKLHTHPHTRIVSYLFPIPTFTPVKTALSREGSIPIRLYTGQSIATAEPTPPRVQ